MTRFTASVGDALTEPDPADATLAKRRGMVKRLGQDTDDDSLLSWVGSLAPHGLALGTRQPASSGSSPERKRTSKPSNQQVHPFMPYHTLLHHTITITIP